MRRQGNPLLMSTARLLCAAWLAAAPCLAARGEVVVVTSIRNPIDNLTRSDVVKIFMGRDRRFPDGRRAIPVDAPPDSPERRRFYRLLVDRSVEQMDAYWTQLVMIGSTRPPLPMPSTQALMHELAEHSHMLGYAERHNLTRELKVVYSLEE